MEVVAVDNSGRAITGRFRIGQIQDRYFKRERGSGEVTWYSFSADGSFSREEAASGNRVYSESGSYLIGTQGELILYIERVRAEQLAAARTERYQIVEESTSRIELRNTSDALIRLERALP